MDKEVLNIHEKVHNYHSMVKILWTSLQKYISDESLSESTPVILQQLRYKLYTLIHQLNTSIKEGELHTEIP